MTHKGRHKRSKITNNAHKIQNTGRKKNFGREMVRMGITVDKCEG